MAARTAGYTLTCALAALVLGVSGFSYYVVQNIGEIGGSDAIQSGPSIGAQTILLMGLESRTGWNGNVLPQRILSKLHAGSRHGVLYEGVGGNDTNTLILIHIFAGGQRAVGFSIPRDDLVTFADMVGPQQEGKIDQAYGVSMFYKEGELRQQSSSLSQNQVAFQGNEAGRAAAVATVEALTGVRIDHFAEVNLAGFYELAKVFGGVEVCLNHAVNDHKYSGAHFRKGYQHLDAEQSLAFVRQRHGLTNGDLDRTHRQQAFIDSIIYQLRHEGVLSDVGKVNALLAVAKRYVITDSGWNLLDFAGQMRSLTGRHLIFRTLPIKGYSTWGNPPQDVNIVDPAQIKAIVHAAFYPPPAARANHKPRANHKHGAHRSAPPAPKATVTVLNGTATPMLAARVTAALAQAGYPTGKPGNTPTLQSATAIRYGPGAAASARAIAKLFGATAAADSTVKPGNVELLLGPGATVPTVPGSVTPSATPSATPVVIPSSGPQGGTVVTGKFGIPCVD